MKRSYLLSAFQETPWLILPEKLLALEEIVERHLAGEKLDAAEVQARIQGASRPDDRQVGGVAVLPLFGTIFPRANLMTEMSGATSAERFGAQFSALLEDPQVSAIVLDVNSPGGSAFGIPELSQRIFDARGTKPVVAVANHWMASGAYWLGTSADEVVVAPSGEVGSIGAYIVHQDLSAALAQDGVRVSLITKGKYKVEGNPYEPLGETARTALGARVQETYDAFVAGVARNRNVDIETVLSQFGEGRMISAQRAVELGMADRVGTLEETVNRLLSANLPPESIQRRQGGVESIDREAQALRDYLDVFG